MNARRTSVADECRGIIRTHMALMKIPVLSPRIVEALLLAQLDKESGFDPDAVSPAGAKGVAQFTDSTWREWGEGNPFDVQDAVLAQMRYMNYLYGRFREIPDCMNRYRFALASYNAGIGNINEMLGLARERCGLPRSYQEWQKQGGQRGLWQKWWFASQSLFDVTRDNAYETLDYVDKVFIYVLDYVEGASIHG